MSFYSSNTHLPTWRGRDLGVVLGFSSGENRAPNLGPDLTVESPDGGSCSVSFGHLPGHWLQRPHCTRKTPSSPLLNLRGWTEASQTWSPFHTVLGVIFLCILTGSPPSALGPPNGQACTSQGKGKVHVFRALPVLGVLFRCFHVNSFDACTSAYPA